METILLIGIVQSIFLTFLIIGKKDRKLADYLIISVLIYLGTGMGAHWFFTGDNYLLMPKLLPILPGLKILAAPLFYLFILSIGWNNVKFKWKLLLHLLPFLLYCAYGILITSSFTSSQIVEIIEHNKQLKSNELPAIAIIQDFIYLIYSLLYIFFSLKKLSSYEKSAKQEFSVYTQVNLNWIRTFILSWLLLITAPELLWNFVHVFSTPFVESILSYIAMIGSVSLTFFLGYYGFKQKYLLTHLTIEDPIEIEEVVESNTNSEYQKSGLIQAESEKIKEKVLAYFNNEKPYLDSELTLSQVAKELNVVPHHLSQVLNQLIKKNFFQFVNEYRIEEFKSRLADEDSSKYSIQGLAFECGFKSKSSFNRVFKNITGLTPSDYKKELLDNS